ncbi:MAG: hypothetical protein IT581_12070 [Verrucomicrobiales bacterium]|nr:hypothetical protein [Verrucomicrobiales bacterium]
MKTTESAERYETRLVRHDFTTAEKVEKGSELARAMQKVQEREDELKASASAMKAGVDEAKAAARKIHTDVLNGFDTRMTRCRVVLRPKERKKEFYPEIKDGVFSTVPSITEDMTDEDYQLDLIASEQRFERRAEIAVFKGGLIVLGRWKDKWHAALRVSIGAQGVQERLDPTAKSFKLRADAWTHTVKRLEKWVRDTLGDETWKGFEAGLEKIDKIQIELVE